MRFKNYANSIRHTGVGLKLDRNDRLELVLNLLESIEPEAPVGKGDIMNDWLNEAESRYQKWKRGEMILGDNEIILRLAEAVRKGWELSFEKMAEQDDDGLLDKEEVENPSDWDETDWTQ